MNSNNNQLSLARESSTIRPSVSVWFLCAVLLLRWCPECLAEDAMFYRVASDQPTRILSLDSGGLLVWSNAVTDAVCRIESISSLSPQSSVRSFTAPIMCMGTLMTVRMPLRPVPSPVVLSIYSDGWGTLMETRALPAAEPATIWINETNSYFYPARYYAFGRADNSYTKLCRFTNGESVFMEIDPVPDVPFAMTGVIFGRQSFFSAHYLASTVINVSGPSGPLPAIMTDQYGRYLFTNAVLGTYTLDFTYQNVPCSFDITNSAGGTAYQDLYFHDPIVLFEPNIYLYPQTVTDVELVLGFPNGGYVSASTPLYTDGWNVRVDTNGIIDQQYEYLFYEAVVPRPLDSAAGWLLDGADLESAFRELLSRLGFIGREVDDFVDHWVPIMEGAPWYAVYWQDAAATSTLRLSPQPQSILRAHFAVRPLQRPISIPAPTIPPFRREGFAVVEWGVLGWGD